MNDPSAADTTGQNSTATATIRWRMGDWQIETQITAPRGPTRLSGLLPILHEVTNQVVDAAVQDVEKTGERVSCCAGCGACCRQLVPIAEVEARDIARVVSEMPEPRQSQVRARFAAAQEKLTAAGLWQRLEDRARWTEEEGRSMGMDYFRAGLPCPFLENESCSIHPDRPSACREYLVTSPAENCAAPSATNIDLVPVPKTWPAMALFDKRPEGSPFLRWVPLSLALAWAESQSPEEPAGPGTKLVEQLFQNLATVGRPL